MAFLSVGEQAPNFSLANQRGELVSLEQFKDSKNVVVYFYPKAMTPGCTCLLYTSPSPRDSR